MFSPNILGTVANNHQITTLSNMMFSFEIKWDHCKMGPVELIFHNLMLVEYDDVIS